MSPFLPLSLLSHSRATAVQKAADDAQTVLSQVFPPRPEDPDGSLALVAVEILTNQTLRQNVQARVDKQERRWWLEGYCLGFLSSAVNALSQVEKMTDMPVVTRLDDMENHIRIRVPEKIKDSTELVFNLCRDIAVGDDVSLAWHVDHIWEPVDASGGDPFESLLRFKNVLTSAVNTACASWQLYFLVSSEPQ